MKNAFRTSYSLAKLGGLGAFAVAGWLATSPALANVYEFVSAPGGIDYSTAEAAAAALTYDSVYGHLATVTSSAENALLLGLVTQSNGFRRRLARWSRGRCEQHLVCRPRSWR